MNLFKTVLSGMEDNNEINGTTFGSWNNAKHALDTYAENFDGECDSNEMELTINALDKIINSNESSYFEKISQCAVTEWNICVWGKNFSNNSGSVPFGG